METQPGWGWPVTCSGLEKFVNLNCEGKREEKKISFKLFHKNYNVDLKCLTWLSLKSSCNASYGALNPLNKVASSLNIHFGREQTCAHISARLWL